MEVNKAGYLVDEDDDNVKPRACSALSCFLGTLCFPQGMASCLTNDPNEELVLLDYGKYNGTIKTSGCHWVCATGRTVYRVSTKVKSIMIPETKTIDKNGNPLVINGILAYQIRNSKRAMLDVESADWFVSTQGMASLKQIVSRYPYEGGDDHGPCLKTAADVISQEMVHLLQERVSVAGVQVLSFTFNEISYAPEIAQGMLKRQQANAILQARKLIVSGAVDIAQEAIKELSAHGIIMDDKMKVRTASNLLTVICSDSAGSNVVTSS